MRHIISAAAIVCFFCAPLCAAPIDDLYREYGRQMIQLEILQGRIQQTKNAIAQELQTPPQKEEPERKTNKMGGA